MKLNKEDLEKMLAFCNKINTTPLVEIEFFENGKKINISTELIENFEDIGLNNVDFFSGEYYKG